MARLEQQFSYTGSMAHLTAYRIRGSETIYLRTKGGPSKEQIQTLPRFEKTRLNNSEFGGRAHASRYILWALSPHKVIADFNFAGPINAMLKPIQQLDTQSEPGKRNIYLSRNPKLFEGFEFNRRNSFSSIVRNPLQHTLSVKKLNATIDIPALLPGVNFVVPGDFPFYSFLAKLDIVPDVVWLKDKYEPLSENFMDWEKCETESEWYPVASGSPAFSLSLSSRGSKVPQPPYTTILSISIRFGRPGMNNEMKVMKYIGAGRILSVDSLQSTVD